MNTSFIQIVIIAIIAFGTFATLVATFICDRLGKKRPITCYALEAFALVTTILIVSIASWKVSETNIAVFGDIDSSRNCLLFGAPIVGLWMGAKIKPFNESLTPDLACIHGSNEDRECAIEVAIKAETRTILASTLLFVVWTATVMLFGHVSTSHDAVYSMNTLFAMCLMGSSFGLAGLAVGYEYRIYRARKQIKDAKSGRWIDTRY